MKRFFIISFLGLLWLNWSGVAQQTGESAGNPEEAFNRTLYESVLLDVENLQLTRDIRDSIFIALKTDAQQLAAEGNWSAALELLNTLLDLFSGPADAPGAISPLPPLLAVDDPPENPTLQRFEIESGVDYSQQEFEVALVETDSVLVEELQNPYVSFGFYQPFRFQDHQLILTHRLRMDNQFMNYNLFANYEKRGADGLVRVELDESFFYSQTGISASFLDNRVRVLAGDPTDLKNRWYVSARGRYKVHTDRNMPGRDVLSLGLTGYYEHFFTPVQSTFFAYSPALYREKAGYAYWQQRLETAYRYWEHFHRFLELRVEGVYYQFRSEDSETPYENSYYSLSPRLDMEWKIFRRLGFSLDAAGEIRTHRQADAINPDYNYYRLQALPKYYFSDAYSVGMGYSQEEQRHRVDASTDVDFARQADFRARGVALQVEYFTLSGTLFNLEYRATWRNYPHATVSLFNTYYSDRFVHSLSLLGWIPLSRNWFIQLFANYDNDQDRENVQNDTRSTLINLGIIYKF